MLKIIISNDSEEPFMIEIDESKTLLDLKKLIAKNFNSLYTGFIILNGNEALNSNSNNKKLKDLNIKRILRICNIYLPAGDLPNEFANLSEEFIRMDTVSSYNKSNIPDWRTVGRGINLYGICQRNECKAYGKQVIMPVNSKEYDIIKESFMGVCPMCHKHFDLDTCSFYLCDFKCEGTYFDNKKDEWVDLPNKVWKTSMGFDYYFDYEKIVPGKKGKVKYKKLILKVINYHDTEDN